MSSSEVKNIKEVVKAKYGQAALRVTGSSCCGAAPGNYDCCDPITSHWYNVSQISQLPRGSSARFPRLRQSDRIGKQSNWRPRPKEG